MIEALFYYFAIGGIVVALWDVGEPFMPEELTWDWVPFLWVWICWAPLLMFLTLFRITQWAMTKTRRRA